MTQLNRITVDPEVMGGKTLKDIIAEEEIPDDEVDGSEAIVETPAK